MEWEVLAASVEDLAVASGAKVKAEVVARARARAAAMELSEARPRTRSAPSHQAGLPG